MKTLVLGLTALLAVGGAAQAQNQNRISNISGAKLVELCTSRNPAVVEQCTSYISGVSDTISFYQFVRPMDGSKGPRLPDYICVPGPTTGPQLREAVVKWVRDHANAGREPAAQVTIRALNDTYLCPGEQRPQ
jgi:hypothetical protein